MRPTRYAVVTESFAPRLDEVADTARHLVDGFARAGDAVLVVTHGSGAPSYRGVPVARMRRRVPTREVAATLDGFGPDGVDGEDHHPGLRDPSLRAAWAGDADLVVGHVGPLDRHKVVSRLRRVARLDGVRLVVLGTGPGARELRDAGARTSTAVTGLDLARALASLDVLVQARGHDRAVPGVRLALASGVPVVGFDAGGTRDVVVHRHNGLLAAPGDDRGLASLVQQLRADEPLRRHLAGASRPSAVRRTWAEALAELRLDHLRPRPEPVHLRPPG
ncbi:MAG: glycosyltransferase [Marmoricola sp.]